MLCTINNSGKHLSQNRNRLTAMENKFMVTEGERGGGSCQGGINEAFGINIMHTTIYKKTTQSDVQQRRLQSLFYNEK